MTSTSLSRLLIVEVEKMIAESKSIELDDSDFVHQFEDLSLDPKHFNHLGHLGHLRIAWLYLRLYELNEANERVCSGIRSYAESLGAKDKFNLTITDSLVKIMAKRIDKSQSWGEFVDSNPDLVCDALGVLLKHYSEDVLFSERAKIELQETNIEPI